MAKNDGTSVDEVVHILNSPISTEISVSLKILLRGCSTDFGKQEIFSCKSFHLCQHRSDHWNTSNKAKILPENLQHLQSAGCKLQQAECNGPKFCSIYLSKFALSKDSFQSMPAASCADVCWDQGMIQNEIRQKC